MARVTIPLDEAAALPRICVCCGEPATQVRRQEFPLTTGVSAAVLAASAMLGALVLTNRGIALTLPVCEYHKRRGRKSNRTFFLGMGLTTAFGIAAYVASQFEGSIGNYLGVTAMISFIVTLVVAMQEKDDGLRIKTINADAFTLAGVSREFAQAAERRAGEINR